MKADSEWLIKRMWKTWLENQSLNGKVRAVSTGSTAMSHGRHLGHLHPALQILKPMEGPVKQIIYALRNIALKLTGLCLSVPGDLGKGLRWCWVSSVVSLLLHVKQGGNLPYRTVGWIKWTINVRLLGQFLARPKLSIIISCYYCLRSQWDSRVYKWIAY